MRMTLFPAVFNIVVYWMVISRRELKRREIGVTKRPRRNNEALAYAHVLEVVRFAQGMLRGIKMGIDISHA